MHSGSKFRSVITSIFHQSLGYLWEIVEKMKGLVDSLNWNKVGLLVSHDCSVCFVCLSLYNSGKTQLFWLVDALDWYITEGGNVNYPKSPGKGVFNGWHSWDSFCSIFITFHSIFPSFLRTGLRTVSTVFWKYFPNIIGWVTNLFSMVRWKRSNRFLDLTLLSIKFA